MVGLYAAFGSSEHLITGPMAATAALSAAAVGQVAAGRSGVFPALTVTLAITTGVLALAAGLGRLGFVANFTSGPVLKGFTVGLGRTWRCWARSRQRRTGPRHDRRRRRPGQAPPYHRTVAEAVTAARTQPDPGQAKEE